MALINKPGQTITVSASAARSAHRFVDISGGYPAASGDAVGVIQSDYAASGDKMTVVTNGIVPIVADGSITAGAWVQATSAGKAITQTTGFGVGRALTSAGDGELVSVQLALPKEAYSTYGIVAFGSAVLVAGTKTVATTAIRPATRSCSPGSSRAEPSDTSPSGPSSTPHRSSSTRTPRSKPRRLPGPSSADRADRKQQENRTCPPQ